MRPDAVAEAGNLPMIVATVGALCFVAGVVVGSGVAFILEDRKGKKAKLDSDYKWRTDMSYLLGHLIRLGYETEITPENLFLVDAPGATACSLCPSSGLTRRPCWPSFRSFPRRGGGARTVAGSPDRRARSSRWGRSPRLMAGLTNDRARRSTSRYL